MTTVLAITFTYQISTKKWVPAHNKDYIFVTYDFACWYVYGLWHGFADELVQQSYVGECSAWHHRIVTATRTVRVEFSRRQATSNTPTFYVKHTNILCQTHQHSTSNIPTLSGQFPFVHNRNGTSISISIVLQNWDESISSVACKCTYGHRLSGISFDNFCIY